MDLLGGVHDVLEENEAAPNVEFELPSLETVLDLINHLNTSEEEKAKIKKSVLEGTARQSAKMVKEAAESSPMQFLTLMFFLIIISSLMGFMGYKLWTSMVEKERAKEEKKKLKEEKKQQKTPTKKAKPPKKAENTPNKRKWDSSTNKKTM